MDSNTGTIAPVVTPAPETTKPKAKVAKAEPKAKTIKAKAKAEPKAEVQRATPKAPKDALHPFRVGCNADVAWRHVLPKLVRGGKINHEDVAKGFIKADGDEQMAPSRATNFLPWVKRHGMVKMLERGTYELSAELMKLAKKQKPAKAESPTVIS